MIERDFVDLDEVGLVVLFVVLVVVLAIPAYEVGKRRGLAAPKLAFIPLFGPEMVILASVGVSMWWAVVILVPYVGVLALDVWLAFVVPPRHGRRRWWTVAFLVPLANLVAFYAYAFTLRPVAAGDGADGEA